MLFVAVIFRAVSFVFWLGMPNYWGFLIGFVLWGINSALSSGTQEALIYDELKRLDILRDYTKLIGHMELFGLVGTVLAGFSAAALAPMGYRIILILSIAAVLAAASILRLLPKAPSVEPTGEVKYWHYLSKGVQFVFHKRKVLFIVAFAAIVTGFGAVDEYYNLLFKEQGLSNAMIAFWMGVVFAFGALGSTIAHRLEGMRLPLTLALFVWAGILGSATFLPPSLSPLAIGLYVAFLYIIKVLFNTYLQNELDDKTRATATSVNGLMIEFGALIVFGLFAIVGESHTYTLGFQIITGAIAVAAVIYGLLHRHLGMNEQG